MPTYLLARSAFGRELIWLGVMNGASVSTLYWAQSLLIRAAAEFDASPMVRLMPGATLAGYAAGVALLAAVARDLTSPVGLILHLLVLTGGLCAVASADGPTMTAVACLVIGLGCSVTQRLLASATSAAPAERRAETIGWMIAFGLSGIVLARACVPVASGWLGWRTMFWVDAVIIATLGIGAAFAAGRARRSPPLTANATLPAAAALWRREPTLRQAALQQAIVFAAFNAGWALYPRLLLHDGVAPAIPMGVVASLGAGAAIVSGRLCARSNPGEVARAGLVAALLGILVLLGTMAVLRDTPSALSVVAMAALDIGTQMALVANQARAQAIASTPALRGRLTAMVTTVGFAGGAIGAALGNFIG